jgi:hypothetical protein
LKFEVVATSGLFDLNSIVNPISTIVNVRNLEPRKLQTSNQKLETIYAGVAQLVER